MKIGNFYQNERAFWDETNKKDSFVFQNSPSLLAKSGIFCQIVFCKPIKTVLFARCLKALAFQPITELFLPDCCQIEDKLKQSEIKLGSLNKILFSRLVYQRVPQRVTQFLTSFSKNFQVFEYVKSHLSKR